MGHQHGLLGASEGCTDYVTFDRHRKGSDRVDCTFMTVVLTHLGVGNNFFKWIPAIYSNSSN